MLDFTAVQKSAAVLSFSSLDVSCYSKRELVATYGRKKDQMSTICESGCRFGVVSHEMFIGERGRTLEKSNWKSPSIVRQGDAPAVSWRVLKHS